MSAKKESLLSPIWRKDVTMIDATYETRAIMGYLGFKQLTKNPDAVDECHRLLLKADSRHDINKKGAIGTLRVAYIRNGCLSYLRKMRGEKYKFHSKMCTIIMDEFSKGNNGLIPERIVSFKEDSKEIGVDGDLLLTYIRKCSFLTKRAKDMIYDRFIIGLTLDQLAKKYKTKRGTVHGSINRSLTKIRQVTQMDTFLC